MVKEETRGQKTILKENQETITFYSIIAGIIFIAQNVLATIHRLGSIVAGSLFGLAIFGMKFGAKPVYGEKGQLLDGGVDLNMKGGYVEHLKDLIIWTTLCQTVSLLWSWLWCGLVLIPVYAGVMLWINVIAPYIFQPAPEVDQEQVDKKSRKRDRQMRRMQ